MTDEGRAEGDGGARQRVGDGIKSGIGVLSALKDALEETLKEARERGDLSTERAKELVREALDRAQSAASDARERLDFANHAEVEELRARVWALEERVAALEGEASPDEPTSAGEEGAEAD